MLGVQIRVQPQQKEKKKNQKTYLHRQRVQITKRGMRVVNEK